MSNNDRLQENNKGTMGTLFRRMTMASLGLDAMEDVSEQSFEVIDRADTFAERLLGGVTRMMPRDSFERIGIATSSDALWKEVYSGIVPSDGPKSATDVGEWQYWLDAVLLTLFDEDEEEAEMVSGSGARATRTASTSASSAAQLAAANAKRAEIERKKREIRERVAQLNASGVKPAMLRQLSVSKQREIAQSNGLAEKLASRASVSNLSLMTATEAEKAGVKVVTDPVTGKAVMTVAEAEKAGIKVVVDPSSGKAYFTMADAEKAGVKVVTDPVTGKAVMTVAEAEKAGIKVVVDPSTGKFVPEVMLKSADQAVSSAEKAALEQAIRNSAIGKSLSGTSISQIEALLNKSVAAGGVQGYSSVVGEFANALIQACSEVSTAAGKTAAGRASSMDLFASNSNQIFASHVLERAKRLEASGMVGENSSEAAKLMRTWRENVERFSRSSHQDGNDVVALHEMQRLVREMSSKGFVTQAIADQFSTSSRTFAARSLEQVLAQDQTKSGSALISRIENSIHAMTARHGEDMLVSSKAVTSESPIGIRAAKMDRAEHLLATSFENFSSAVRSYVDRAGSNAATMRFERASERYEQLSGLSDEQDRVLLRDLVESATQLEVSGIIPRGTVSRLVKNATSAAERQSSLSVGKSEQMEMLQSITAGADRLVATLSTTRNEKLGRQFSRLMSNVDNSLSTLVSSLKAAGIQSSVIEPLVRDITQIKADGIEASVEENVNRVEMLSHSLDSFVERALGALPEQGYDELDTDRSFVAPEASSSSSVESGYVAGSRSSIRSGSKLEAGRVSAQLEEVRQYVANVAKLQREAEEKFTSLIQNKVLNESHVSSDVRAEIAKAVESRNIEQLVAAQKAVSSKLSEAVTAQVNAQIEEASKRIEQSRARFETVSKQVREIERAAEISRMLHVARDQAYVQNIVKSSARQNVQFTTPLRSLQTSVSLGGTRLESSYLPALNEAIQSYAKLREEYARFDTPSLSGIRIEETTQRLDRMMTLLQTSEQQAQEAARNAVIARSAATRSIGMDTASSEAILANRSEAVSANRSEAILATRTMGQNSSVPFSASSDLLGQQFGYDEIVPDTFDKIKPESVSRGYASIDSVSSFAPMLGSRKALELHAAGLLQGNHVEAGAFKTALSDVLSSQTTVSSEPVTWQTVNELGERVKMTVANGQRPSDGFALRSPIGESYQPAALRGQADISRSVTPVIDIQKLDSVHSIGGAEQFVPVMLGGSVSSSSSVSSNGSMSQRDYADLSGRDMVGIMGLGMASSDGKVATTAESASKSLAHTYFDSSFDRYEGMNGEGYDGERRLLSVSLGGTNVAMTPEAYVQTVAEPQISSSARALSFGSDALYESFASVLSQQGASRSLGSLRRTFFEKLSAAGRSTARGWIGLNSQSFASLLGIQPDEHTSSHVSFDGYDAQRGEFLKSGSSAQSMVDGSLESISNGSGSIGSVSYETSDSSAYADMSNSYMRSFVSGSQSESSSSSSSAYARGMNAVPSDSYGMQLLRASSGAQASSSDRQASGELLGHIDSLLDYVEDVSNRNVGVFSTNEVVRVLVEQLPRESYLGEKGLPQWRQKDIRARQVEEARELREALKKIGATPVQGMQRIHDKNYVSPNLIPQTTASAPLFSGGSDGGSTPTTASSLSGANSNSLDQGNIPAGDLEIIADEVYDMILESLNEELKRRRSE